MGMSAGAIVTAVVILIALVLMMASVASPDVILLGAVLVLVVGGILEPAEAFSGFANPGMLTVAALFVVAAGLRETGAISMLATILLGRPRGPRGALARLIGPVIAASAFLNNTTVVAALLPGITDWSRRIRIPASRLLLPLSYASILGGTCTLIGTSTNLVVAGLVAEVAPRVEGLHELGMFEITAVGVPVALAGALVLMLVAPWLLPDRRPPVSLSDDPRNYTMELIVTLDSRLAGRTIEEAGLRHLPGAFLMEIVRQDHILPAVAATERLEHGDRLVFVGDIEAMVDLQRLPGLAAAPDQVFRLGGDRTRRLLAEAVVSHRNPLVGRSVREGDFRSRYRAVIIAVARAGERLSGRIGDVVLRAGDVLLLEAQPDFLREQRSRTDFYLVSRVDGAPPRTDGAWMATGILACLVAAVALAQAPTVVAAFLAAGAMVLTRCCTLDEARRALDLQVLVAIAAAFGLGHAMHVTGLAESLANLAITAGASNPIAALVILYVLTAVLTEVVTNNAAAVLALPVALSLAARVDAAPMGFVIVVMMAASASFLTPIGYQTNLMVYGPGGYRAGDYLRVGAAMSLVTGAVTVGLVPLIWPL